MTQAASLQKPSQPDEIVINLYCPGGIQCAGFPCFHGPNWAQKPFSDAVLSGNFTDVLAIGGFGSGKTSEAVRQSVELAVRYPGNAILLTRKYTKDVDSTIAPVCAEVIPQEIILKRPTQKQPFYVVRTSGEKPSQIWVMGLYGTDRKRIGKLKGQNFGAIIVDQAEELSLEDHLFLKGRLRLATVPFQILVYIANPPNIGHWLHNRYEVEKLKGSPMFKLPTWANQDNLPPDYITNLRADYKDRPGWLQTYLNGDWGYVVIGDPALRGFKDETHLKVIPYDSSRTLFRSWDFGWQHPAVSFYQIKPGGGPHKLKEIMGTNILIRDFGLKVVTMTNELFPLAQVRDFGDHAGNQRSDKDNRSSIQILKDEYNIKVETKPNPQIDGTVGLMQKHISLLNSDGIPSYTVDPSCRITIDGVQGGYCRDEKGEIIKDGFFEHIMDTDRYLFWNLYASGSDKVREQIRNMKIRSATYGFSGPRRTH